mgnify:CR=1 FL=1|tara:strand:+ start:164 stop:727 length:564 start_codon:yes stop_codon:yes gene_type:complete
MQITDNALNAIEFKMLLKYFTSELPTWRFLTNVTHGYKGKTQTSWGFTCNVFGRKKSESDLHSINDKHAFKLLQPLILDKKKLIRIRCGLIASNGPKELHTPHVDQPYLDHITQIYYLTASDAPTNIFEELGPNDNYDNYEPSDFTLKYQSKPEPNKMIIFDGKHYHSSSHVYGDELRLALTFNYAK